jgi:predicted ester cyclase
MSTEENKAIVRRALEEGWHWNEAIFDEVLSLNYVVPGGGGPEMAKAFQRDMHRVFPDFTCTIEEMIAERDKVMVRCTYQGTHQGEMPGPYGPVPPTSKVITYTGVNIYRLVGGKIVEDRYIGDGFDYWQQLGVIPAPNQSPS